MVGEFWGYKGGRVYQLDDGSRWRQEDWTEEPVYRQEPTARLIHRHDVNMNYLDVEGTSAMVRVSKCGAHPKPRAMGPLSPAVSL
ncbi:MAG: hypothetical protein P4L85_15105 [Paludisphaera borealis]|uniref:hypothetical protein n=1 Tax=Paludisphaera borealis TaxID=1387353 RepID=UPI00284A7254|nr:hypothetical protein [Paludisphaera borealis]MDR3620679.1 hypothetical protein [Paludisphaera borealis]